MDIHGRVSYIALLLSLTLLRGYPCGLSRPMLESLGHMFGSCKNPSQTPSFFVLVPFSGPRVISLMFSCLVFLRSDPCYHQVHLLKSPSICSITLHLSLPWDSCVAERGNDIRSTMCQDRLLGDWSTALDRIRTVGDRHGAS